MWLAKIALQRPYTFVVLALLIMLLGVFTTLRIPIDIFPNINIPVVAAIWSYTGLSPDDMSKRIILLTEKTAQTDVSNVERDGKIRDANNRMRASSVANRLWHTDASFVDPPGRYSMLSARVVPPVRADTEFADMRAAYDALDEETRASIE